MGVRRTLDLSRHGDVRHRRARCSTRSSARLDYVAGACEPGGTATITRAKESAAGCYVPVKGANNEKMKDETLKVQVQYFGPFSISVIAPRAVRHKTDLAITRNYILGNLLACQVKFSLPKLDPRSS